MTHNYSVTLERRLQKRPPMEKLTSQLQHCIAVAIKSGRGRGLTHRLSPISDPVDTPTATGNVWVYKAKINFAANNVRFIAADRLSPLIKRLAEAGCAGPFRMTPWKVIDPPGYSVFATEAQAQGQHQVELKKKGEEEKKLGDYSLDPKDHFRRLFGREAQMRRILDAFKLADKTGFLKRNHSLLDGPPGCGKSELMLALSRMLGEEGKAWLWFDATSMTKAGVIEELMNAPVVPGFIFIEEIEKTDDISLRWLLGVMDTRGIIRRTNYRVGNQARHVRMVVVATANDVNLLKGVMSGALYSRFQNKIFCPPPDRTIMEMILQREIAEMKGKEEWIEPALEFAYDKWGMTDPRDVITICTCGGNRLLTGAFQKDYEATMHPAERRMLLRRQEKRNQQRLKGVEQQAAVLESAIAADQPLTKVVG